MSFLPGISVEAFPLLFCATTIVGLIQCTAGKAFGTILAGFTALIAPAYAPGAIRRPVALILTIGAAVLLLARSLW